jgi:hypothetical protein
MDLERYPRPYSVVMDIYLTIMSAAREGYRHSDYTQLQRLGCSRDWLCKVAIPTLRPIHQTVERAINGFTIPTDECIDDATVQKLRGHVDP